MWPFGRIDDRSLGRRGEKIALKLLKCGGAKILARNYRCPAGEADLIVLDGAGSQDGQAGTIVFVEVKTRSSDRYTDPEAAVDAQKRKKMRKIAEYYLATHDAGDFNVRFDVVAVVLDDGAKPQVKHIANAF